MNVETSPVRIKGVGNSLWLTIVPDTPFDLVQAELTRIFEPLRHLVGTTRIVLDTGNEKSSVDCRRLAADYLKKTFNLNEIAAPREKETVEEEPIRKNTPPRPLPKHHRDTLVLAGRVRSGQGVQAKKHLIIMGDVNPGCQLTAGGDIIVLGSLRGSAAAGQPDNEEAIILALDFQPTQIKIADFVAAGLPGTGAGRGIPEYAHLENEGIVVDDYAEANPFNRMPWPIVR
jgi:septum site-determining protein MinC